MRKIRTGSLLVALAAGVMFALGLGLSGMVSQAKVLGFLDLAGVWDPSLAFVMIGAIGVHWLGLKLVRARTRPLFEESFSSPTKTPIDASLLLGAALFGIGWGLGGFCPGPVLVSAATGAASPLTFIACMLAGMLLQHSVFKKRVASTDS
jgi:uncharacterized protein